MNNEHIFQLKIIREKLQKTLEIRGDIFNQLPGAEVNRALERKRGIKWANFKCLPGVTFLLRGNLGRNKEKKMETGVKIGAKVREQISSEDNH